MASTAPSQGGTSPQVALLKLPLHKEDGGRGGKGLGGAAMSVSSARPGLLPLR